MPIGHRLLDPTEVRIWNLTAISYISMRREEEHRTSRIKNGGKRKNVGINQLTFESSNKVETQEGMVRQLLENQKNNKLVERYTEKDCNRK